MNDGGIATPLGVMIARGAGRSGTFIAARGTEIWIESEIASTGGRMRPPGVHSRL